MSNNFQFPSFYNLPPFFTLQPVIATREKQIQLWVDLIISYCKHNKITSLTVSEHPNLFENKSINRKLTSKSIELFLNSLIEQGKGEWVDKNKTKCFIYWKSPAEWSDILLNWASETGHTGVLCTVYELRNEEKAEFYQIDEIVFQKACQILVKKKKIEYYQKGQNPSDEDGIKFLN